MSIYTTLRSERAKPIERTYKVALDTLMGLAKCDRLQARAALATARILGEEVLGEVKIRWRSRNFGYELSWAKRNEYLPQ